MKYCKKCNRNFENENEKCTVCGIKLVDTSDDKNDEINENEAAEIISTMMITGIL